MSMLFRSFSPTTHSVLLANGGASVTTRLKESTSGNTNGNS
ncbi:MAG: hypothetical protein U0T32_01120 [Chitinophagales bacterium]